MPGPSSYLLCGTPRTGSTLLCSLLSSTGVAGRPESYFREPDQRMWAERFGVSISGDGSFDYTEFVSGAVRSGSTTNGVFAARVMWGTLFLVVSGLDTHPGRRSDKDVLEAALGTLRFVHLRRRDVVGQAVSWARAEQSGYWQHGDEERAEPRLDVDYESLVSDPGATVNEILAWIGTRPPADWAPLSPHRRQANEVNAEGVRRYRASRINRPLASPEAP